MGFDYGQRHAVELEARERVRAGLLDRLPMLAERLGQDHRLDLKSFGALSDSALTSARAIEITERGLPSTFVPGRNLAFFVYAAALADRRGIEALVGGMCETDYSGYPDCRRETLDALQSALRLGMARPFAIQTPLMRLTKAQTWALAHALGRRSPYRPDRGGEPHLLSRRARRAPCLGLWLRRLPGVRAARAGLARMARQARAGGARGVSYAVKELFLTLQGEGGQAGRAAVFCRFAGCNLWSGREADRAAAICSFCDTDFVGARRPRRRPVRRAA